MNCDFIAPFYEWFEKAAFGGKLQKHRVTFLAAAKNKQRALILGDGDGRFAEALIKACPELHIDSVDLSLGMVLEARKRCRETDRVRVIHSDVFQLDSATNPYDIAFSHFFLDCFDSEELFSLVQLVSSNLEAHALWIISDFRRMPAGWRKFYSAAWLKTMYLFFRIATGLKTRELPNHRRALESAGFTLRREQVSMAGLIASEWWER
jgi:ubiquinone/menaquinone biosynthesis C-methylase UbiE